MRNFLLVFILLVVVLSGIASAAPALPEEFYGYVSLNGNPAPAGTIIVAKINDQTRGTFTTTSPGQYGGSGNFDPRLVVTSTEEELSAGTASVVFFVDGVQAFQAVPFKSGTSEKLDLVANTRAFSGDTASGSSQSGSGSGSSGSGTVGSGSGSSYSSGGSTSGVSSSSPQSYSTSATAGASTSRSSIYYSETTAITQGATVKATPILTAIPNTTSVPATTKAGFGAISVLVFAGAIIGTLAYSAMVRARK